MTNQDTLLTTIIIVLGFLAYWFIRDEFRYIYNHDRTIRTNKKTGKTEVKTYDGWE